MTPASWLAVALSFIAGACMRMVAHLTLRYKEARLDAWSRAMAEECAGSGEGAQASAEAKAWYDKAMELANSGDLEPAVARICDEFGLELPEGATSACRVHYSVYGKGMSKGGALRSAAIDLLIGGCYALAALGMCLHVGPGQETVALWAVSGVVAAHLACECDLRARMIPLWVCNLLFAGGMAWQFHFGGLAGMMTSIAIGIAMAMLVRLPSVLKGDAGLVGGGDVAAVAAVAVYLGTAGSSLQSPPALVGSVVASVIWMVGLASLVALNKVSGIDKVPMAPYFLLWMMSGVISVVA